MMRHIYFRTAMRSPLLAVTACLIGCSDGPITPEQPAVWPEIVWAGGDVLIRSRALRGVDHPKILADTMVLEVQAAGADSAVVRIPGGARGTYTLRLGGIRGRALGNLTVLGFNGRRLIEPGIGTYLLVWPEGSNASIIGGASGTIYHLTPATGEVRPVLTGYWGGGDAARLPGRTPDPELLLLQPIDGSDVEKWRLLPEPQLLGTLPATNDRHFAQLSDSVVLFGYHHRVETRRLRGTELELRYLASYEETHEVIISPSRDRATLIVNGSATGPPVFDTQTGDTAYHVRQLFRSYGVAFSTAGDTLWMVGVNNQLASKVVVLDARSGSELSHAEFPDYGIINMRKDPAASRLFITAMPKGAAWDAPPVLLVIDAKTLQINGRVEVPQDVAPYSQCAYCVVAVGSDGVFLVEPGAVWAFDYPE